MNDARCEHTPTGYCRDCLYLRLNLPPDSYPPTTPHPLFVPNASFGQYPLSEPIQSTIVYYPPSYPPPGHSPTIQPFPNQQAQDISHQCYPEDSEGSNHLRALLVTRLNSPWYTQRQLEPQGALDHFIYELHPNYFVCSVHGCGASRDRLDRMRDHFRLHIDHRPYPCSGCHIPNCVARFCTKETRRAHERIEKRKEACDNCGQIMDKKNLKRHRESQRCKGSGNPGHLNQTDPHDPHRGGPTI